MARGVMFALSLLLLSPAWSQNADAPGDNAESMIDAEAQELERAISAMEQVIVTGRRPIIDLMKEGERLTEDFYARLNEVLDNDDFRITCENRTPLGSRISRRECQTGFQRRFGNRFSRDLILSVRSMADMESVDNPEMRIVMPHHAAEALSLQSEMKDAILIAVNVDPILNEQVVQLLALKRAIEGYRTD